MCSALAKLKDNRFNIEVHKIKGADFYFLFGFYYRQIGKYDKALEMLNKSMEIRPNFSKAKREMVQVYIGMQDFMVAKDLAKENYLNYRDNPYHIQGTLQQPERCDSPACRIHGKHGVEPQPGCDKAQTGDVEQAHHRIAVRIPDSAGSVHGGLHSQDEKRRQGKTATDHQTPEVPRRSGQGQQDEDDLRPEHEPRDTHAPERPGRLRAAAQPS